MINPACVENFSRTDAELEEFLLFTTVVAGKNALVQAQKLEDFLGSGVKAPFRRVRALLTNGRLESELRRVGMGQYARLRRTFESLVTSGLDLRTCTVEELEHIPGIGPKTARFFVLYTRPGARVIPLDVHLLHYLRDLGYDAPRTTPSNRDVYRKLEEALLLEADQAGLAPSELDIEAWKYYSGTNERGERRRVV